MPTTSPAHRVTLADLPRFARDVLAMMAENAGGFPKRASARLPGLEVLAHGGDGPLLDAIGSGWSSAGAAEQLPGGSHSLQLFVSEPELGFFPQAAVWGEPIFDPVKFDRRLEDAGLRGDYLHDRRYWQIYDIDNRIGAQLMTDPRCFPPWEPGAPLRSFLHWDYASRGMRLAHAGTLGLDGHGVMFAGAGGSGKSGTVLAGILNGLDSVGDDYVLVGLDGGVTAYPLFTTLKQDPAGWNRLQLGDRLAQPAAINWQGKYQFRLADVVSRPIPGRMPIVALMLPEVTGGDITRIAPLSRKKAMVSLASSGLMQLTGDRTGGFRFFGELVRRLPCYSISLGVSPREIAETIGEFIGRAKG